ncbi:hypothetical protein ISN45_At01g056370 [Arabidopsis thaliana x Arabidopsis arenosa]|uniref:Uncharacterized protein n=2 Tax=Arabidopsis TaxID=3701 RepID=A0A8T2HGN7_ARASU|nr:hypothetical protein ISN45_At01g056370 [Arabidopsis thaliana x Arabidopsis arenosa]KAG7658570.1 hypothetical protein ISN44_As01g055370 [Arabidopsis suecica]
MHTHDIVNVATYRNMHIMTGQVRLVLFTQR